MSLTIFERIQLAMLCDLAKRPRQRVLDFEFIQRAVLNDDLWALDRKFIECNFDVPMPPEVELVHDKLWMWDTIEGAYERLNESDKERVRGESPMRDGPHFPGFFGCSRLVRIDRQRWHVDELRIAQILVHDLKGFPRYEGEHRLIAGSPFSQKTYDRMLCAWRPIYEKAMRDGQSCPWDLHFSADEIIQIVRERVDPSKRQVTADGWWAPYEPMDVPGRWD